ncbi:MULTISPECIES: sigma 54-interacting transcriptional regulator [Thauera]|uniref:Two component sigma-54 specific Fis family transcriptional regulator n=2 Tax=Thauera aminoaromatica TaxID=164330 RepID=N6XJN7_THASP|nr:MULTISPECIES: sigma 54-interacting transcriptional regulator [Thauera]MDA0234148.1 sigma 54-interacting transcriptional regulator [Pseudomonadota bacterium]ENO81871.1 two component sigma-54 specific Fis family transcriptional regulator [Thauera aminoaromatica S2]KIN92065.1 AAA domain family protein [Thauera sp. SWB20]MBL8462332.1 sigma 54-interacting transcriptional regulator [Thauera sp.]MBP6131892.1 sigma 54-interacting transcriptional regulator [Thauera sp.]
MHATAAAAPARLLVVDDDADLLRLLAMRLQATGYDVATADSVAAARSRLGVERFDLVVSDVRLPDGDGLALFEDIRRQHPALPVILLTAHGTIPDAVEATALGVAGYLTKPFDSQALLQGIRQALQRAGPTHARSGLRADAPGSAGDTAWRAAILSRSSRMQAVLDEARLVAAADASVLIRGDSGTGKELLARAIHLASPRAAAPFVAINCGAIPEPLLESELFGHVRGAFTGATSAHQGLVQAAHGGTLFLDEIGDMPPALQVKLLRVLQERAVRPVGATRAQAVDLRIVSATHRDLDAALAAGQFRADLYYRIDVVSLQLPTLAERREDIPLLAGHFLRSLAHKYGRRLTGFAPEALEALATAPWPGNVRQLHNVVEQACALATTALIPRALVERALRVQPAEALGYAEAKRRFERNYLIQLLKLTAGNVSDAARLAERNRTEFYRLLQRHDLTPELFRGAGPDVEQ